MAFRPDQIIKRYDAAEQAQLLDALLELAAPKEVTPPQLIHYAETIEEARKLQRTGDEIIGLSTGYKSVDALTGGMQGSQVIIVFGDTGHRKSMFVQNITANVARAGTPVLFIGLEMSNAENTERILSITGDEALPIVYPPHTDVDYKDIDGLMELAVADGVGLVVVDHLHMFEGDGENQAASIAKICREMKRVTRKHNVPMILVSHINEDKYRTGVPNLKDLLGSSSIKQIADTAIAIYSPGMDPSVDAEDTEVVVVNRKRRNSRKRPPVHLCILENARLEEDQVVAWQPVMSTANRLL